jgi:hypothetical protein
MAWVKLPRKNVPIRFLPAWLKKQVLGFLEKHFGKAGNFYFNVVRGVHNSAVKSDRITNQLLPKILLMLIFPQKFL